MYKAAHYLYKAFWTGLDLLFPPFCGGCGMKGARWCRDCHQNTEIITPPVCLRCGESQKQGVVCSRCRAAPIHCSAVRSWAVFKGPMRRAIHQLKYHRDIGLADALAGSMISLYKETNWGIDLIVPVPLSIARLAERGYNQSVLIARPLALGVEIVYRSNALERTRDTRSQVDLNAKERKENVAGAFRARSRFVQNKRVLVVDDVTTSGATLEACAVALLEAGALEVFGLTLARATYSSHKASP